MNKQGVRLDPIPLGAHHRAGDSIRYRQVGLIALFGKPPNSIHREPSCSLDGRRPGLANRLKATAKVLQRVRCTQLADGGRRD